MTLLELTIASLQNRVNESRNRGGLAVPVALTTMSNALTLLKEKKPDEKEAHWREDVGAYIEGERDSGEMIDQAWCSWCGFPMYWKTPYCPNCGRKMTNVK